MEMHHLVTDFGKEQNFRPPFAASKEREQIFHAGI